MVVQDDGPGIPADQVENVFERFVRLDQDRSRESGGTGLGLPTARGLARNAGGEVRAVAGEGGGAAFELTIPAL